YAVATEVIARVRDRVANLAGIKCSESPFERVAPYLALGLPVYIGNEPMLPRALAQGAIGTVSGFAAALPDVVRGAVDAPDADAEQRLVEVRGAMERQPFIASVKHVLRRRGVPIEPAVRAPQRWLTDEEAQRLDEALELLIPGVT
ncbi:MAG: dihydrodipicolinate synthase family protein, partial [Chloroflexota bacterium]|nr:dihydrodipicolinate synthase family protein [Chloroflexota bacterium]